MATTDIDERNSLIQAKMIKLSDAALVDADDPDSFLVQMHGWEPVRSAVAEERARRARRGPDVPMPRARLRSLASGHAAQKGRKGPFSQDEKMVMLGIGVNIAAETVALCDEVVRVEEERDALRRVREALTVLALREGVTPAAIDNAVSAALHGAS